LLLAGCGGASHGSTAASPAASAAAAKPPPADVSPAALLARADADAEVLLRLSVARGHPMGPRLEPFVLAWPGWGATIRRVSPHPLAELDWIDVIGPRDAAKERMATRTHSDDATIDARLASSGDGSLRVVTRGQPHLVTAAPPDGAAALAAMLGTTHVVDPVADPDEGLRAELPNPHVFFKQIPEQARKAALRVFARPAGAAEARLVLTCDNMAIAAMVGSEMRTQADQANGMVVRLLTHDLLGGLSVEVDGNDAKLRLPASREQLEALATLAAAVLPPESAAP
jgi:hypothetical protein